jgi:hypothetical protein
MTLLLVHQQRVAVERPVTRFGGVLTWPKGKVFEWPVCGDCGHPMQFQGQILTANESGEGQRLLLIFMCVQGVGCDTWSQDGGGNLVIKLPVTPDLHLHRISQRANPRPLMYGARLVQMAGEEYEGARSEWARRNRTSKRRVLGQLGGEPVWLQGEEQPICACGRKMRFVAQLEEGVDEETPMNFGGGCAYVFDCECDEPFGALIWQQESS